MMEDKCPCCDREIKGMRDFPRILVAEFERVPLAEGLEFPHEDHTIFVDSNSLCSNERVPERVLGMFSKGVDEVYDLVDGWNWRRREAGSYGREYVSFNEKGEFDLYMLRKESQNNLLRELRKQKEVILNLDEQGELYFQRRRSFLGADKIVLAFEEVPEDVPEEVSADIVRERKEHFRELGEIRLSLKKEEGRYNYHRNGDDRKRIITYLDGYFSMLESLVGKEVPTKEALPEREDGHFRWVFYIPETVYNLSFDEHDSKWAEQGEQRIPFRTDDGKRIAKIVILGEGPNLGSAGGPTLQSVAEVGKITYEGILNKRA